MTFQLMVRPGSIIPLVLEQKKYRTLFTPAEDDKLRTLVDTYGTNAWMMIASHLPSRTARQCRERYNTYLSPNVDNSPWTCQEDRLLVRKVLECGSKWSVIRSFFGNRTVNNIKNRWNTVMRRLKTRKPGPNFEEDFIRCAQFLSDDCELDSIVVDKRPEDDPSIVFSIENLLN